MSSDVDEYLKAITQCKGVDKIIIMSGDGFPIKTTIVGEDITQYTYTYWHLAKKATQLVKMIDYNDDARLVRFRSKKNETLMALDPENGYIMIIVQTPKVE